MADCGKGADCLGEITKNDGIAICASIATHHVIAHERSLIMKCRKILKSASILRDIPLRMQHRGSSCYLLRECNLESGDLSVKK